MIKREQIIEAKNGIEDGMGPLVRSKELCWQNELVFWLCKAVLLLIEKEVKGAKG